MSASRRFLTRSLLSEGFLLFSLPARMANVWYAEKSASRSNSISIFCANTPKVTSKARARCFIREESTTERSPHRICGVFVHRAALHHKRDPPDAAEFVERVA